MGYKQFNMTGYTWVNDDGSVEPYTGQDMVQQQAPIPAPTAQIPAQSPGENVYDYGPIPFTPPTPAPPVSNNTPLVPPGQVATNVPQSSDPNGLANQLAHPIDQLLDTLTTLNTEPAATNTSGVAGYAFNPNLNWVSNPDGSYTPPPSLAPTNTPLSPPGGVPNPYANPSQIQQQQQSGFHYYTFSNGTSMSSYLTPEQLTYYFPELAGLSVQDQPADPMTGRPLTAPVPGQAAMPTTLQSGIMEAPTSINDPGAPTVTVPPATTSPTIPFTASDPNGLADQMAALYPDSSTPTSSTGANYPTVTTNPPYVAPDTTEPDRSNYTPAPASSMTVLNGGPLGYTNPDGTPNTATGIQNGANTSTVDPTSLHDAQGNPAPGNPAYQDWQNRLNQFLGYGSLLEPFTEPFTGQSALHLDPWDQQFNFSYDDFTESPAYKTMMDEGFKTIQRSAATGRGAGLYSGGTDKNLLRFAEGLTASEFNDQYNRALGEYNLKHSNFDENQGRQVDEYNRAMNEYNVGYNIFKGNQNDIFNKLSTVSGGGQVASSNLGGLGSNFSNSYSNSLFGNAASLNDWMTSAANAQAQGGVGAAGARAGAVNNVGQSINNYLLLKSMGMLG